MTVIMARPVQFRLRTIMAVVFGLCLLLSVLRWLGPDATIAIVLMATGIAGALGAWPFRRPLRGAVFGAILPIAYVLSIEPVEHIGHRAGWPGSTWNYCSLYESLWYRQPAIGSARVWRGYWLWQTWCEDMSRQFGSNGPVTATSCLAVLLICGTMLLLRRRQHPALVAPAGLIAAGIMLITCHDFDAVFFGYVTGGLAAILTNRAKLVAR